MFFVVLNTYKKIMENDIVSRAIKELETKIAKESLEAKEKKEEEKAFYEKNLPKISPGIVIEGVVVGKSNDGVLVSIGLKEEGIIPLSELSLKEFKNPDEVVSVGDKIDVIVLSHNNGNFILSKKRTDLKNALDRAQKAFNNNEILQAIVSQQVKGGLIVDLGGGVPGFIPVSQIKQEAVRNLDSYVGKEVRFKIIEFDRRKRDIILSLKKVEDDEERERREKLLGELLEGKIIEGKIQKLTDFGAFVDIGGMDGLIPVSEISYKKINHPRDVLKKGEIVSVVVIKINRENKRVSLSLKNALPSPWEDIRKKLSIGSVVFGRISRVTPTYAFVTIEEVEGFLPKREIGEEVLEEGQEVRVRVIELNPEKERMTLSLRGAKEKKNENEMEKFLTKSVNIGFKLGDVLQSKKDQKWK